MGRGPRGDADPACCGTFSFSGSGVPVIGAVLVFDYYAFARMMLEMYYAMIRMSEDIREMRNRQRGT